MHATIIDALRARAESIRESWESLLRGHKASTPLANPDTLIHYIPNALDRVFEHLQNLRREARAAAVLPRPSCSCGHNPFLAFYLVGEQVMMEALVLVQAERGQDPNTGRDVTALQAVFRRLAVQEIESFCGLCTHHHAPECTRFPPTPGPR